MHSVGFLKSFIMRLKMMLLFLLCVLILGCGKEIYKNSNYRREFKGCHYFNKGREKPQKKVLPKQTNRKIKRKRKGKTPKSYERW